MTHEELEKSIDEIRRVNPAGFIAFTALLYANVDGNSIPESFQSATRGQLKRAIKYLRSFQSETANKRFVEEGILFIRKYLNTRREL